jgi:cell division transport system permease protein
MSNLVRIIKFALQGFFRNGWLSLVTITMMFMAIFSITLLIAMDYLKQATIAGVEQKVDILVSLKPALDKDKVESLVNDLQNLPEVKKVRIITPEENRKLFEETNLNSKAKKALDVFTAEENPFSYSLAIQAYNLNQYSLISDFVQQDKYKAWVEDSTLHDYDAFVKKIDELAKLVNRYSWYLIAIFILISIVVIFNTVRMSIYTRRNEVMIMKLVGAGNWFIKAPFILESIFYTLIALLVIIALTFFIIRFIQPSLSSYFQDAQVIDLVGYFKNNFIYIFGLQFLGLIGLNTIATSVALKKYLDV